MKQAWAAALAVSAMGGTAWGQPSFRSLGFLDPELGGPSIANAVSADGSTVVGQANSMTGFQAFRWTAAGGMVGMGAFPNPGGFQSSDARAVSGDGSIIGGASIRPDSLNENGSPFRWTAAAGLTFIGALGGSTGGAVDGISRDGFIMVGSACTPDFSYRAFKWTQATGPVALPNAVNQVGADALAVTPDGSVIVGSVSIGSLSHPQPAKWTLVNGAYEVTLLPMLISNAIGYASGVTPDGSIIVGSSAGRTVRWTEAGGVENLGLIPGGSGSTVYFTSAVSDDGSTIVGLGDYNAGLGLGTAFIWDRVHGMRDLNIALVSDYGLDLHGFECFWARGMSSDGKVIAGYGFSQLGQEPFVADLRAGAPCYANCDGSTGTPALNVNDFVCFQSRFAAAESYADCDHSGSLNVNDFVCFQASFAAGCR